MFPGMLGDKKSIAALIVGGKEDKGMESQNVADLGPSDASNEGTGDMSRKARIAALKKFSSALQAGNFGQAERALCVFMDLVDNEMDDSGME